MCTGVCACVCACAYVCVCLISLISDVVSQRLRHFAIAMQFAASHAPDKRRNGDGRRRQEEATPRRTRNVTLPCLVMLIAFAMRPMANGVINCAIVIDNTLSAPPVSCFLRTTVPAATPVQLGIKYSSGFIRLDTSLQLSFGLKT